MLNCTQVASFPGLLSVLKVTEMWVGPGNEANAQRQVSLKVYVTTSSENWKYT